MYDHFTIKYYVNFTLFSLQNRAKSSSLSYIAKRTLSENKMLHFTLLNHSPILPDLETRKKPCRMIQVLTFLFKKYTVYPGWI